MRDFIWSRTLAVNIFLTNTPPSGTTIYIGSLHALAEEGGTTGYAGLAGATLTVGGSELSVPTLRGGTPAGCLITSMRADYIECKDAKKASSCQVFDANNLIRNHTVTTVATRSSTGDTAAGPIAVRYLPGAKSSARVAVSLFEWAGDSDRLGPF